MDIPAETAISEAGLGQYEINLVHGPALKAADDAWLFKLLLRGMARKYGFAASFMAKPYAEWSGHRHARAFQRPRRRGGATSSTTAARAAPTCCAMRWPAASTRSRPPR